MSVDVRPVSKRGTVSTPPEGGTYAPVAETTRRFIQEAPPTFTKYAANPVDIITGGSSITSMYWPCVMRVDRLLAAPLDRYYKWDSTNHDLAAGGVRLSTAPTPFGPWTDRGLVYQDATDSGQTEEPRVIWNPLTSQFHLFYQNSASIQWAGMAKSSDGVTWTRFGKVLAMSGTQPNKWPGSGAQGYMEPMVVGDTVVAFHLMGGGDYSVAGMSYSDDYGETWVTDKRNVFHWGDVPTTDGHYYSPVQMHPFIWRGQPWMATTEGPAQSGLSAADTTIVAFPVSRDLRQIVGKPRTLLTPSTAWETADSAQAVNSMNLFIDGNTLYLYYVIGNSLGVASAIGASA